MGTVLVTRVAVVLVVVAVAVAVVVIVVGIAIMVDVIVVEGHVIIVVTGIFGDGFLARLSAFSLCSAPANNPMNTEVRSRSTRATTRRIFARVVIGSFAMSFKWSENDFFVGACAPCPLCSWSWSWSRRGASSVKIHVSVMLLSRSKLAPLSVEGRGSPDSEAMTATTRSRLANKHCG